MSARDRTVMMARVKNEARWIARTLERTWPVAATVVIFDDGSTDTTEQLCIDALGGWTPVYRVQDVRHVERTPWGWIGTGGGPEGPRALHFMPSPFTEPARDRQLQRISEIRDKNTLWSRVKVATDADYILCLDGDEMLSLEAIAAFPAAIDAMDRGGADLVVMPFVYLWDREDQIRVDGIYGLGQDGLPRLRFPRLFTIKRQSAQCLFDQHFAWQGTRGGFHCGSVPMEAFRPGAEDWRDQSQGRVPYRVMFAAPIIHFGYLHAEDRQAKYEFYNRIDPNNEFEGQYRHIIGEPNRHAEGPVVLEPWVDKEPARRLT